MTWDAVVIGAGPAGAVTARGLARRGRSVLLVDKATFPRAKVCGGCLNGAALAALAAAGLGHVPAACGAVPLDRVRVAAGRRTATLPLPAGAAVEREPFDFALLNEARAASVYVRPHEVELTRAPGREGSLPARVVHVNPAGPVARVHLLSLQGDLAVNAQVSVEQLDDLGLQAGDTVHVTPRRVRVFVPDYSI